MRLTKQLSFLFALLFPLLNSAQILEATPAFPTQNDVVTITYDASEGNAALVGQTQIYAHTGVITSTSTSLTNWQYVKGTWGQADPTVAMTSLGNNKHQITINISQFYNYPQGTTVLKLAFVFRTASGAIVGRSADGSDIYYDIYPTNAGLIAKIFHPNNGLTVDLNQSFSIDAQTNSNADLEIFDNGNSVASLSNASQLTPTITPTTEGTHLIKFVATNGNETKVDSVFYTVNPTIIPQDPPAGLKNGINYIDDNTVTLQLYAPEKEHIYVIGDFNNWTPTLDYHMNRSTDNATWWLTIDNLTPGQRYGYQYYIDGNLKLADPLSPLVLDPSNDGSISAQSYPNPHPYPVGKTTGFVTIMHPGAPSYNWTNSSFIGPENKDLMIYELHVRDFVAKRNYQTLIDTIDYLANLGINAIELMPPGEFEGNESWGYNPSFHMALDKYYGTPEKFKEFIDTCHSRGIAVIVDMVLNHAFGQNPMVRMYWDAANNRPAANSPWFNAICPHEPYCWGYDLNHTKQATKDYIDRVNQFWIEEYKVDGFRFDYTKGFINNGNGYSDERIAILKRMADTIWNVKEDAYIILEHWCDNNEEKQLADYGMMLWGNLNYAYRQAVNGYVGNSNTSSGIYSSRGWTVPHLVSFMESHDEERVMYDALTFGLTTNPDHNVRNSFHALSRSQAAAVILFVQPGPKMIWQFGELGYDISIDVPCRVCNKPVLWNYYQQSKRKQTYDVYSAVLKLRTSNPTFKTLNINHSLSGAVKRILHNDASMNAVTLANFAVTNSSAIPAFQHTGWWYEYFTGDSLNVTDVFGSLNLAPGEYRIYTDIKMDKPQITESTLSYEEISFSSFDVNVFPNPTSDVLNFVGNFPSPNKANLKLIDVNGAVVYNSDFDAETGFNKIEIDVKNLPAGTYHLLVQQGAKFANKSVAIVR